MRMEELRKFKEDQMNKKNNEWRERRQQARRKNEEAAIRARKIVRGHRREVPIHEELEKRFKENVLYPEAERAKKHLDMRKEERMVPMGDSIKTHEASYLQSQARRIQRAAQNNSEMVRAREIDLGYHVNKEARANVIADDIRARTEAKLRREAAAARVAEARKVGNNYEREHMPAISASNRQDILDRQAQALEKQRLIEERKNKRYSEDFMKQAHNNIYERGNPVGKIPKRPKTPEEKRRVKIDYIAELRAQRTTPTKPIGGDVLSPRRSPRGNSIETQQRARQAESLAKRARAVEEELARRADSNNPRDGMDAADLALAEAHVDELYRDAIQRQLEVLTNIDRA
jgi:hypothetical protein